MVRELLLQLELALEVLLGDGLLALLGDVGQLELLALDERWVAETLLVARVARLDEVVHVQLAHERREVVVLEVLGQHFLRELVGLVDHEAVAVVVPVHSVVVRRVLLGSAGLSYRALTFTIS